MATLSLTYGSEYFETGDTIIGDSIWTNYSDIVTFVNNLANGSNFNSAVIQSGTLASDSVTTAKVANNNITHDKLAAAVQQMFAPVGSIVAYAGPTPPTGWLVCDGSAQSRTSLSTLFGIIGTAYGSGDGSTTFNIPNLKGKVPVGYDASQTEFDALGETGGEKTVTLTTAQLAVHTHANTPALANGTVSFTDNGHTHGDSGGRTGTTDISHNHALPDVRRGTSSVNHDGSTTIAAGFAANLSPGTVDLDTGTAGGSHHHTIASAQTGISGSVGTAITANNAQAGGGEAHNNLQPYAVINYIIRTV